MVKFLNQRQILPNTLSKSFHQFYTNLRYTSVPTGSHSWGQEAGLWADDDQCLPICYILYMYSKSLEVNWDSWRVHSQKEEIDYDWSFKMCIYNIYVALTPTVWPVVSNSDIQTHIPFNTVQHDFLTLQSIILKCETQFIFSKWSQEKV